MEIQTVDLYEHFGLSRPENASCRLTCYLSPTPPRVSSCRRKPGVLILPGGGYNHTSLREGEPVALRFVTRGYTAFVLDYSCAPAMFPVPLQEAALAMRFIRENAGAFEVNPGMVAAVGFSAGGHLCGMLGTMFDCPEVAALANGQRIRPDALGLCYPVAVSWGKTHTETFANLCGGDDALRQRLSLDKLIRPDMPPVFLWHTRWDASVPCRNSLILARALEEAGVDFAFHLYRLGIHGLSTADAVVYPAHAVPQTSAGVSAWLEEMAQFFGEIGFAITDSKEA